MSQATPTVGDIGFELNLSLGEDISAATTKQYFFEKPAGTRVTVTAVFDVTGIDGVLSWTTTAVGDLDEPGLWKVQAHLGFPGGADFGTTIATFTVIERL